MSSVRLLFFPVLLLIACTAVEPQTTPDASLKETSTEDAGTVVAPVPCYADAECGESRCLHPQPFAPASQWSDPSELDWAAADVVAGYATLYNNHVDLRVRFRDTPFEPKRSQTLRVCLDTDADASTGTACGAGVLAGADTAFTYRDGELVEHGPIDNPCIVGGYDAPTRTIQLRFDHDTFPVGDLEQQFRYVILSSYVSEHEGVVTDTAPDDADFSRVDGAFQSEHTFKLWSVAGKCCRFGAGTCVGGSCGVE